MKTTTTIMKNFNTFCLSGDVDAVLLFLLLWRNYLYTKCYDLRAEKS